MIVLLIYITTFVLAFAIVRLLVRRAANTGGFNALKTVTFGDESAVVADRSASIISVVSLL